MKYLLITFITIVAAQCNTAKTSSNNLPSSKNDNSTVVINYQTGPCFGSCPTFNLTINGKDKMMTYKGTKDTVKQGIYSKPIADNELSALVAQFESANFFTLDDSYLGNIVDFPINTISYSNNGKSKSIRVRGYIPKPLEDIQKTLQAIAKSDGWEKAK
jgi:hypothetical protein